MSQWSLPCACSCQPVNGSLSPAPSVHAESSVHIRNNIGVLFVGLSLHFHFHHLLAFLLTQASGLSCPSAWNTRQPDVASQTCSSLPSSASLGIFSQQRPSLAIPSKNSNFNPLSTLSPRPTLFHFQHLLLPEISVYLPTASLSIDYKLQEARTLTLLIYSQHQNYAYARHTVRIKQLFVKWMID